MEHQPDEQHADIAAELQRLFEETTPKRPTQEAAHPGDRSQVDQAPAPQAPAARQESPPDDALAPLVRRLESQERQLAHLVDLVELQATALRRIDRSMGDVRDQLTWAKDRLAEGGGRARQRPLTAPESASRHEPDETSEP